VKVKKDLKIMIYMYVSNNITRFSSMINNLGLCQKQNKSHISRSMLQGVYENYVEFVGG
jgi:hypothetical protein